MNFKINHVSSWRYFGKIQKIDLNLKQDSGNYGLLSVNLVGLNLRCYHNHNKYILLLLLFYRVSFMQVLWRLISANVIVNNIITRNIQEYRLELQKKKTKVSGNHLSTCLVPIIREKRINSQSKTLRHGSRSQCFCIFAKAQLNVCQKMMLFEYYSIKEFRIF